jgi:hypothetical protein
MRSKNLSAVLLVASVVGSASAGVVSDAVAFADINDWLAAGDLPGGDGKVTGASLFDSSLSTSLKTETFDSLALGSFASVSGGTVANWWNWTAASTGSAQMTVRDNAAGRFIASSAPGAAITFVFGGETTTADGFTSGLRGIGGGFRFFDSEGGTVNGRIRLTLSDGSSLVRNFSGEDAFAGFWLTAPDVTIRALTIEPFGTSSGTRFVGAHTLYMGYAGVAIPAPGAIALLGAAGLIGSVRRRA